MLFPLGFQPITRTDLLFSHTTGFVCAVGTRPKDTHHTLSAGYRNIQPRRPTGELFTQGSQRLLHNLFVRQGRASNQHTAGWLFMSRPRGENATCQFHSCLQLKGLGWMSLVDYHKAYLTLTIVGTKALPGNFCQMGFLTVCLKFPLLIGVASGRD